jgi:ubiquinone/menaquinone biosynthesis C-methylase UbiE
MANNPNDVSADIYDLFTKPLKGEEVTNAEVRLINTFIPSDSKILDIGGGTGRHAIPLAQAGHEVTVVDLSTEMLRQLEQKRTEGLKITTLNVDVLEYEFPVETYDLIIMMWNALNEIALTEDNASLLLSQCKRALKPRGKMLININNPDTFDPAALDFQTEYVADEVTYKEYWHVVAFDESTRTSTSRERIQVIDREGKILKDTTADFVQRWWSLTEIQKLAAQLKLNVEVNSLPINAELYLIV